MKLKEMAVQNVRSFGEKRTINLNNDFTILIGPNAGGKSNLLDIITVGLRKFFIRPWRLLRHEDASGQFFSFTSEDPFQNFFQELSKFEGATGHSVIEFEWEIDAQDIGNMEIVKNRLDVFRGKATWIRGGREALDLFKTLNPAEFKAGDILRYVIDDGEIKALCDGKGETFRQFLQHFNKLTYIDQGEDTRLTTPFLHFPSYRGTGSQRLRMSLASQTRWNFELAYAKATSRQTVSLIELATFHFASKRRRLVSGPQ